MDKEEVLQLIKDCQKREPKMTEWEQGFIQSLSEQVNHKELTPAQIQTLERIWERIT